MSTNKTATNWPSKPKDYDLKGILKETSDTRIILAHCALKERDVICKVENIDALLSNLDKTKVDKHLNRIKKLSLINPNKSNVLSPLHTFHFGKEIWMIYEQINGGPLQELLHNEYHDGIHNEYIITTILHDVAHALHALHSSNLVHRNISSQSLLMCKDTGKTYLAGMKYLKECKKGKKHHSRAHSRSDHDLKKKTSKKRHKSLMLTPNVSNSSNSSNISKSPSYSHARHRGHSNSFFATKRSMSTMNSQNRKRRFSTSELSPTTTSPISSMTTLATISPKRAKKSKFRKPRLSQTRQKSEAYFAGFHDKNGDYFIHDRKRFIDPLMLDPKNNESGDCNWFDSDIYSFGVLAMELYFGSLPPNLGNDRLNINDYNIEKKGVKGIRKPSMIFCDLIEKCTAPIDRRISMKKLLIHPFLKRKCGLDYNAVISFLNPLDATHTRISIGNLSSFSNISSNRLVSAKSSSGMSTPMPYKQKSIGFDYQTDAMVIMQHYDAQNKEVEEVNKKRKDDLRKETSTDSTDSGVSDLVIDKVKTSDEFVSEISNDFGIYPVKTPLTTLGISKFGFDNHKHNDVAMNNGIIVLNVGGICYQTTISTLCKYSCIFSDDNWTKSLIFDCLNNCYFIDRNGKYFGIILDFMRNNNGELNINKNDLTIDYAQLLEEAMYYKLTELVDILNEDNICFHSTILPNNDHEAYINTLKQWIAERDNNENENDSKSNAYDFNQKWKLIYRASDDGFESSAFHRNCDMRGSTITLISANNRIFGGFTDIEWNNNNTENEYIATNQECANTFIFLLNGKTKQKWNYSMKYYNSFGDNLPVTHDCDYGPTFSNILNAKANKGIVISNKCNVNNGSCWNWCCHYDTPKAGSHLAGNEHFFVSDIEVYQISFEIE